MVLKPCVIRSVEHWRFENDVEMYGTQTYEFGYLTEYMFENDVEMYGTQTDRRA